MRKWLPPRNEKPAVWPPHNGVIVFAERGRSYIKRIILPAFAKTHATAKSGNCIYRRALPAIQKNFEKYIPMKNIYLMILALLFIGCTNTISNTDVEFSSQQLKRLEQILIQENKDLYSELEQAFYTNQEFAGSNYKKASELRMLVNNIQGFVLAENATVRDEISLSEFIKIIYSDLDSLKIDNNIMKTLRQRHLDYWIEKDLPKHLSNVQCSYVTIDLKMFENELLDYLLKDLTANDFNFNVVKPIVLEASNEVKKGELYEAKICLTAFDTTRHITVTIENQVLEIEDGYAIYRYKSMTSGEKSIIGSIEFPRNNYEMAKQLFKHDFVVK